MDVQLLGLRDVRWEALLARVRHDIDHLPEYLAVSDRRRGSASVLAYVEEGGEVLAVPLRFTELGEGHRDAASAELRASPLVMDGTTPTWRVAAMRAPLARLRELGVVSLFLRFHPLLDAHRDDFAAFGAVVEHGPTYSIRLDQPLEEIRAGMRRSHRQSIRKFQASEFRYERQAHCEDLAVFHELYDLTMQRVGARDDFRFPFSYFRELVDALGERVALWVLRAEGDRVAAAHLVTDCGGIVQGLYAGEHPEFHGRIPQVGLYDRELEWAQQTAHRDYFIGGADHDSLHQFKAGVTKYQPVEFSVRVVADPVEFGRRCADWQRATRASTPTSDAFFPPYCAAAPVGD